MDYNCLTVSEINEKLRSQLLKDANLYNVCVLGEVSGIRISSGHGYFAIKDEKSQLNVTAFNIARGYIPKDGEKVILRGTPDYYVKGGRLSFVATIIIPYGIGELYQRLEELKKRLYEEGLFAEERKKSIPPYIKKAVVVTSRSGAVIRDIITTIRRYNDIIDIVVINTRVQGEGAEHDIAKGIALADKVNGDVIIVARGGGSFEDLFCFNSEEVVRAVAACDTPIISAVGHEVDYTLCDYAADVRVATPTAAAEFVAYDVVELKRNILGLVFQLQHFVAQAYLNNENKLKHIANSLKYEVESLIENQENRIKFTLMDIKRLMLDGYRKVEKRLELVTSIISEQNPMSVLTKGYLKGEKNGETIYGVNNVAVGDTIRLTAFDGVIDAEVTMVKKEKL